MGGHTMREGLTVGRSLSAAAIVRLRRAGVKRGGLKFLEPRQASTCQQLGVTCPQDADAGAGGARRPGQRGAIRYHSGQERIHL